MNKLNKEDLRKTLNYFLSCAIIICTGYLIWGWFQNGLLMIVDGKWPTATQLSDINIELLHFPITELYADQLFVILGTFMLLFAFSTGLVIGGLYLINSVGDSIFLRKNEDEWLADMIAEKVKEKIKKEYERN